MAPLSTVHMDLPCVCPAARKEKVKATAAKAQQTWRSRRDRENAERKDALVAALKARCYILLNSSSTRMLEPLLRERLATGAASCKQAVTGRTRSLPFQALC